jgi:hypothetical protein
MYVRLASTGVFDGFYSYSAFKSLSITCRGPVNINILSPKIEALHSPPPPKHKISILSKTAVTDLIKFQ